MYETDQVTKATQEAISDDSDMNEVNNHNVNNHDVKVEGGQQIVKPGIFIAMYLHDDS